MIDSDAAYSYPQNMEIALTPEQQAQLSHVAALEGRDADELAQDLFLRGLEAKASLIASSPDAHRGQTAANRLLELRRGNMLPQGVEIQDLIRDGRA